jgi:hypothetical protein
VKFKSDGGGWRDLIAGNEDEDHLQVSIDTTPTRDSSHFISIREGKTYAAFHMTRGELRKIARKILKETAK